MKYARTYSHLLRPDGSPRYLALRWARHGALIDVAVSAANVRTVVRVGKGSFAHAYQQAVRIVLVSLGREQDALGGSVLDLAMPEFLARYNAHLQKEIVLRVVPDDVG